MEEYKPGEEEAEDLQEKGEPRGDTDRDNATEHAGVRDRGCVGQGGASGQPNPEEKQTGDEPEDRARGRALPELVKPKITEQQRHSTTHITFESRCEGCVMGRAREGPHMRKEPVYAEDDEGSVTQTMVPVAQMDYMLLRPRTGTLNL